jgi:peroxiredoxin Q/BCP
MRGDPTDSVFLVTSSDPDNSEFGTAFAIYFSGPHYRVAAFLTCRHVITDVGGPDRLLIGGHPAKVVATGLENSLNDVAILRVDGLSEVPTLRLNIFGEVGTRVETVGFGSLTKSSLITRSLNGRLGRQVGLSSRQHLERVRAWDLKIEDDYGLEPGYSGGPVVDAENGGVIAIATYRLGGRKGIALSVDTLDTIKPGLLSQLRRWQKDRDWQETFSHWQKIQDWQVIRERREAQERRSDPTKDIPSKGRARKWLVAPKFTLPSQLGKMVSLEDFLDKKSVVLLFYSKDGTPDCIEQVCDFRDNYEEFMKLDTEVIGISSASVESHKSFAEKHHIPFILLSDKGDKVRHLYGVDYNPLYGIDNAPGLAPQRLAYLIDRDGIVDNIFYRTSGVAKDVIKALKLLKEPRLNFSQQAAVDDLLFQASARTILTEVFTSVQQPNTFVELIDSEVMKGVAELYKTSEVSGSANYIRRVLGANGFAAARVITREYIHGRIVPSSRSQDYMIAILGRSLVETSQQSVHRIQELLSSRIVQERLRSVHPEDLLAGVLSYSELAEYYKDSNVEDSPIFDTVEYAGIKVDLEQLLVVAFLLWFALSGAESNAGTTRHPEIDATIADLGKALDQVAGIYVMLKAYQRSQKYADQ